MAAMVFAVEVLAIPAVERADDKADMRNIFLALCRYQAFEIGVFALVGGDIGFARGGAAQHVMADDIFNPVGLLHAFLAYALTFRIGFGMALVIQADIIGAHNIAFAIQQGGDPVCRPVELVHACAVTGGAQAFVGAFARNICIAKKLVQMPRLFLSGIYDRVELADWPSLTDHAECTDIIIR